MNSTHVMVRLKTAELDIVDTLIAAGIANNRAEAIRWALTRIRERPVYEQLREHTRNIDRLKSAPARRQLALQPTTSLIGRTPKKMTNR